MKKKTSDDASKTSALQQDEHLQSDNQPVPTHPQDMSALPADTPMELVNMPIITLKTEPEEESTYCSCSKICFPIYLNLIIIFEMHMFFYAVISFKVKVEEMEMETPINPDFDGNESSGFHTPPPSLLKEESPE